MLTEEEMWSGLKQGNKEMFFSLYRKYYHTLLFLGLKEVKESSAVKDTISQLFLYLWEKRETIEIATNVRAYITTSFLRSLRANWKQSNKKRILEVSWSNQHIDPLPSAEEIIIENDHNSQVKKYIRQSIETLSSRQKELVEYRFYEGLSYDEIAEKTGLSQRTIYNNIYESLKKIRISLQEFAVIYDFSKAATL